MKNERWSDVRKYKKSHFKYRLKERYGIFCNRYNIKDLVENIRKGNYIDAIKQSNTRLFVLIDFMGQIVYLVYGLKHKVPITALPMVKYIKYIKRFRVKENVE